MQPNDNDSIRASDAFDQPYTWGRSPATYLSPRQVALLAVYRSKLRDSAQPSRDALHAAPSGRCRFCGSDEVHDFTASSPIRRGEVVLCLRCERLTVSGPRR
jgi:hypothetical protein